MKEDIKILKEIKTLYKRISKSVGFVEQTRNKAIKQVQAIENILNRLEQLEIENISLKKQVKLLKDNFTKALDEILKENYIPNINKAIETLGEYKHYSTPDEEQNALNEEIVDKTFNILKELIGEV